MLDKILCFMWGHAPFNLGKRGTHWGALISRPEDPYLVCHHCFKDLEGARDEYTFLKEIHDK